MLAVEVLHRVADDHGDVACEFPIFFIRCFFSLDGLEETHDRLRSASFTRIMDNICNSTHPSLFINFTINNQNKDELELQGLNARLIGPTDEGQVRTALLA